MGDGCAVSKKKNYLDAVRRMKFANPSHDIYSAFVFDSNPRGPGLDSVQCAVLENNPHPVVVRR